MRNRNTQGFTLIELLIVIAIIGILAAVLIPNLLNARERAFDTAAQTCLKEIVTQEEINASIDPWDYANDLASAGAAATAENGIQSCTDVVVTVGGNATGDGVAGDSFHYVAEHNNGSIQYEVEDGGGVFASDPQP